MDKPKNMTPGETYYMGLAEIYLAELEDLNTPLHKIMIAKGVMIEIESDLLAFLKNNPGNAKSKRQQERIALLNDALDHFSAIGSVNHQMKLVARKNASDNLELKKQIHELTRQNKMLNDLINED